MTGSEIPNRPVSRTLEQTLADKSLDQEAEWVSALCSHYKISKSQKQELYNNGRETTYGRQKPTFDAWYAVFPMFPIYLKPTVLPTTNQASAVAKLFREFTATPLCAAYRKAVAAGEDADHKDKPFGILARWPYLCRKDERPNGLVVHDMPVSLGEPGTRLYHYDDGAAEGCAQLTVCTLWDLLAEIDAECRDDEWR